MKDDKSKAQSYDLITPGGITVRVGQVWKDLDKRQDNRLLTVIAVGPGNRVAMRPSNSERVVNIRLDRLKPGSTGYTHISG